MASFQTCTYHSVTLQPGEQFNLPPGAEIISATDPGAISSLNDCANLDNLETPECYILPLIALPDQSGSMTHVWEGGGDEINANLISITVAGVEYPISPVLHPDSGGIFDVAGLQSFITSNTSLNPLFLDFTSAGDYDYPRGGIATLCFKTIPSIGDNLYVTLTTYVVGLGSPEPETIVRVYARKYSDYAGGAGTCSCTSLA